MLQGHINRLERELAKLKKWLDENPELVNTPEHNKNLEEYASLAELLRILKGQQ